MAFKKRWDVLVVDDDEDVLTVSRLALKSVKVYGLSLNVIAAKSKAEAIEQLKKLPRSSSLPVAFVDVMMETAHAGLELCQFIRDDMRNRVTKLIVRTGQAGKAPELEVIEKYDISAYVPKAEATDDKLSSIVKSSVREFVWARSASLYTKLLHELVATAALKKAVLPALEPRWAALGLDATGSEDAHFGVAIDGFPPAGSGDLKDAAQIGAARTKASSASRSPLSDAGDDFALAGEWLHVKVGPADGQPELHFIQKQSYDVPDFVVREFLHPFLRSLRGLAVLTR